jgi:hypothetical protein
MIRRVVVRCGTICYTIVTNDVAWMLAAVHGVVLVLCIANMSPPSREFADYLDSVYANGGWSSATVYAGRPFHLHYESIALNLLTLADLPAEFVVALVATEVDALIPLPSDRYRLSYIELGLNAVFGSIQWLIIGTLFARRLRPGTRSARCVNALRNHRRIVYGTLLIFLLVGAPVLQWRSNELGFRIGYSVGPADP